MNKKKLLIFGGLIFVVIAIIAVFMVKQKNTSYTILFETDGGSLVESQIVKKGEKVKKPNDPTKDGYMFVEWVYQGEIYDFSLEVTKDLTLSAKWVEVREEIETFIVKFDSDGGTTIANQLIEKGEKVRKPVDPIKDNHTFKGWILNDEIYDFEKVVEKDLELKAKWEKNNINSGSTKKSNKNNNKPSSSQQTNSGKNDVNLSTPTITKSGFGVDGKVGTVGMQLALDSMDGITGVEIYSSTTENGTYTLLRSIKKENWNNENSTVLAQKGEHLYFKVRTYVTNSSGTFYSGYSNVIELDNTN